MLIFLNHFNSVITFRPYFSKTHFDIVVLSMTRSPKWSFPVRFPDQNFI